jgi:hypothetical protein
MGGVVSHNIVGSTLPADYRRGQADQAHVTVGSGREEKRRSFDVLHMSGCHTVCP